MKFNINSGILDPGAVLTIHQKEFVILDCDSYTKRLLEEHGIPFGEEIPAPDSLYDPRALQRWEIISRYSILLIAYFFVHNFFLFYLFFYFL